MSYQSVNPFDGKVTKTFPELTDAQLDTAIQTAASCYETWRHKSYAERAKVVAKAAELMHARADEFARHATLEMGKRISESRGEVEFSSNILAYYAKNAEKFLAPVKLHPTVGEAHMESSPIGVVFCVEPWNFPYYQLARVAGPHLMAGNVVMVKHAGCVPQCAIAFEKLWIEAGGPARALHQSAHQPRAVGPRRGRPANQRSGLDRKRRRGQEHRRPRREEPQGVLDGARGKRRVHRPRRRGSRAHHQVGRLGADVQLRTDLLRGQALHRRRQACRQVPREVPGGAHGAQAGGPAGREDDPGSSLDGVGLGAALEAGRFGAVAKGAKILIGGKRIERPGSFMQPTILTDIKPDNPAFRDEFFGPVALFFRVKDEDAAIALANDSDFGLGGSVFTKDIARGKRVASRVETGMMFINNISWSDAELPFGGIKNSGYGRELGDMGIQEFVNKKLVRVASMEAPV
jgi:succinate-semialdehyde dehydrogenase/glutarate-semialdehyde dehydrogenase